MATPTVLCGVVRVFSEDGTCKMVEILADMTARDFCQLLIYKSHCVDDNSWTLVEHHPHLGLERCLEDHELVQQIQSMMTSESKFLFRKNYAKYEFFKNPVNFFPEQMVAWCQQSNGSIPESELLQNFLNANSCPEIQGSLYIKEVGKKSWKKFFVCLRRSGLYCSTKGTSKEPRHLQGISDLEDSNVYSLISCRKLYNSPTDFGFCVKPNRVLTDSKELRFLCADDEQTRTCWMTAFRLLKYGMLLYQNYRIPQQKTLHTNFSAPVGLQHISCICCHIVTMSILTPRTAAHNSSELNLVDVRCVPLRSALCRCNASPEMRLYRAAFIQGLFWVLGCIGFQRIRSDGRFSIV
ncbi:hypothetical protein GDO78_015263 [Eleutherodactylus coqui]|uniref:Growth factor receptor bound protein 10 n=1 Tax=Eleutherodactylus coqui TaxID=57060 RepID=A0A8J6JJZ6_ELECQ|nr:hypothetical protein GDO78_015263 [Eleutherodactylus coqui]